MAVALFIAAIVAACTGHWYLTPFLAVTAIACAAETIHRDRTTVSPLRRRQLDEYVNTHSVTPVDSPTGAGTDARRQVTPRPAAGNTATNEENPHEPTRRRSTHRPNPRHHPTRRRPR